MGETIRLTLPRSARYYSVARVVVGGLAAGIELSFDALDDLQLAIGSLLDNRDLPGGDDVTLELTLGSEDVSARIGPFEPGAVERVFTGQSADAALDLNRLLSTVVDTVDPATDERGDWITLTKRAVAAV